MGLRQAAALMEAQRDYSTSLRATTETTYRSYEIELPSNATANGNKGNSPLIRPMFPTNYDTVIESPNGSSEYRSYEIERVSAVPSATATTITRPRFPTKVECPHSKTYFTL